MLLICIYFIIIILLRPCNRGMKRIIVMCVPPTHNRRVDQTATASMIIMIIINARSTKHTKHYNIVIITL